MSRHDDLYQLPADLPRAYAFSRKCGLVVGSQSSVVGNHTLPTTDDRRRNATSWGERISPADLPVPIDDGACAHLPGMVLPSLALHSTGGELVNLALLAGRTVVYCYPRTGQPDVDPPPGWNEIPGARGCTPQSCGFRDHYAELQRLQTRVFGLSTQPTDYQREAAERLHLPFALLSDEDLALTHSLRLPIFAVAGMRLIKRLTLIITDGMIEHIFYPVFPPDRHASEVIAWLEATSGRLGLALKEPQ